MYQKILAAVNEHLNSEIAARYALRLAAACQAKIYFSFVAERGLSRSDIESAESDLMVWTRPGVIHWVAEVQPDGNQGNRIRYG